MHLPQQQIPAPAVNVWQQRQQQSQSPQLPNDSQKQLSPPAGIQPAPPRSRQPLLAEPPAHMRIGTPPPEHADTLNGNQLPRDRQRKRHPNEEQHLYNTAEQRQSTRGARGGRGAGRGGRGGNIRIGHWRGAEHEIQPEGEEVSERAHKQQERDEQRQQRGEQRDQQSFRGGRSSARDSQRGGGTSIRGGRGMNTFLHTKQ